MVVDLDVGLHLDAKVDGFALGAGELECQVEDGIGGLSTEELEEVGRDRDGDLPLGFRYLQVVPLQYRPQEELRRLDVVLKDLGHEVVVEEAEPGYL